MLAKFQPIGLTSLVSGPGFNNKKGYIETTDFLKVACRAIDILSSRWDRELRPFIDSIPKTSEVNPFLNGISGSTLLIDSLSSASHPYYWNGTRSKTVYEGLNELKLSTTTIQNALEELQSDVTKVIGMNVKRRFSQLNDVPTNYFHTKYLKVKSDESGLEITDTLVTDNTFLGLQDTPTQYVFGGDIVVSKEDQSGVEFVDRETVRASTSQTLSFTDSYTFSQYDLAGGILYLERGTALRDVYLENTFHGAEVIIRSNTVSGSDLWIQGVSPVSLVESEPIVLSDSRTFVHLVFDTSASTYRILGYH